MAMNSSYYSETIPRPGRNTSPAAWVSDTYGDLR